MSVPDAAALLLTVQLGLATVIVLLAVGTPLAWWLAHTRSRLKVPIEATVALPLVLPPTVLGFYLLILMGPEGAVGGPWLAITGETLTFSFGGLVLASVLYSLPFVVQPLQATFETIGLRPMEAAATLGARPVDAFLTVATPMAARGYLTAVVLGFAHTLGEFGVVLMVGGNIPGETRVVSIAVFEHVETLDYGAAHGLSLTLLIFSFCVLAFVYAMNRRYPVHAGY